MKQIHSTQQQKTFKTNTSSMSDRFLVVWGNITNLLGVFIDLFYHTPMAASIAIVLLLLSIVLRCIYLDRKTTLFKRFHVRFL